MPKSISAGILLYRTTSGFLEVLIVHPGGPFFKNKDAGAWSIPKGLADEGEDLLAAARREFEEELGSPPPEGRYLPLTPIVQKAGKKVFAWAVEGDLDAAVVFSNTFKLEYPYKSGKWIEAPEVDAAAWCSVEEARKKLNPAQVTLVEELEQILSASR